MDRIHNRLHAADLIVGALAVMCAAGAVYCVLSALGSI